MTTPVVRALTTSSNSRPKRVSVPMIARRYGLVLEVGRLANLMLRQGRRWVGSPPPPNDASGTNQNAARYVSNGEPKQNELRIHPNRKKANGDNKHKPRRTGLCHANLLKAWIAPGTYHQQPDDSHQDQPNDRNLNRTNGPRKAINDCSYETRTCRNGHAYK